MTEFNRRDEAENALSELKKNVADLITFLSDPEKKVEARQSLTTALYNLTLGGSQPENMLSSGQQEVYKQIQKALRDSE